MKINSWPVLFWFSHNSFSHLFSCLHHYYDDWVLILCPTLPHFLKNNICILWIRYISIDVESKDITLGLFCIDGLSNCFKLNCIWRIQKQKRTNVKFCRDIEAITLEKPFLIHGKYMCLMIHLWTGWQKVE